MKIMGSGKIPGNQSRVISDMFLCPHTIVTSLCHHRCITTCGRSTTDVIRSHSTPLQVLSSRVISRDKGNYT